MSLLQSGIIGILAFIFILGAAVILHEFGHFIVAKLFKIRVETFSVGFGSRLFGRKYGTTDYRISAIPLGGYVKLGGDESNAPIEGEGASDIPANERFDLRPRWQRILVAIAGPVMNILTALSIPFAGAMIYGVQVPPRAVEPNTPAAEAGLKAGDRIVSVNGEPVKSAEQVTQYIREHKGLPITLRVERNGSMVDITATPKLLNPEENRERLGFQPDEEI